MLLQSSIRPASTCIKSLYRFPTVASSSPFAKQIQARSKSDFSNLPSASVEAMDAVKSTLAENFGGSTHKFADEAHQFDIEKDVPSQEGKVAVITGGSEGIGYAVTFVLLKHNLSKVFVISLSKEVIDGALKDISEKLGKEYAKKVQWLQLDIADLPKVAEAAKTIRKSTDRLDILVLNAGRGIMTYELTDYGLDRHMAVNHVGHVVLTSHLLPLMKSTADKGHTVRISAQSSNAHQAAPSDVKFASIDEMNQDLGPNPQYGRSKLANILYSRYLAHKLTPSHPKILVNATHPGFVETKMSTKDIHEPYPIMGYGMSVLMSPFKKTQWMGAVPTLYNVTKTEESGQYICPPAVPEPGSDKAQDVALGEALMDLTIKIVKEKFPKESVDKGCPLKLY